MLNKLTHFIRQHSGTILSVMASIGTVALVGNTVKTTLKARLILDQYEFYKGAELTTTEKLKIVWKEYIPTAFITSGTIACILGANAANKHNQAMLLSAAGLVNGYYKTITDKIKQSESYGTINNANRSLMQERYDSCGNIYGEDCDGKKLFYDCYSGRYFRSTLDDVLQAEADLNALLKSDGRAYLNDYYRYIGLPGIDCGNFIGWTEMELNMLYATSWVNFLHERVILDDGLECWLITANDPTTDLAE